MRGTQGSIQAGRSRGSDEVRDRLTVLGKKVSKAQKRLEVFPAPPSVTEVIFEGQEVTALCPVTGQPDFYSLRIVYSPMQWCVESKSLKLYLWTFRERGAFVEQLSQIILEDFVKVCKPSYCRVELKMVPRGGLAITAHAEYRT